MAETADSPERLRTILKLLDDETPAVRAGIRTALSAYGGDVSEQLSTLNTTPPSDDLLVLIELLRPERRARLRREWIVPAGGASAVMDDWEHLEALLRLISDYLHDGVSLRQPLADALDLLADELTPIADEEGAAGINRALFQSGRLQPNFKNEDHPLNLDLAHVLQGHPSSPLGLGLIFLLLAQHLDLDVEGINMPGGFLCRYQEEGRLIHCDPFRRGVEIDDETFAHRIRRYPREIRQMLARPISPGELLVRTVEELATAWSVRGENEDALLMEELLETLTPHPR